jgi:hypothetical protein
LPFDGAKIIGVGWYRSCDDIGGQVVNVDPTVFAQNRGVLDDVPKLPNISGPTVRTKCRLSLGGQESWRTVVRMRTLSEETLSQEHQILWPLAQRRQPNVEYVDAIEQVFPELALRDRACEVTIRCRDDPHIRPDWPRATESDEFSLLQDAEAFRLREERHLTDFVEEQHTAVGEFELADFDTVCARERPALESEELRLEKLFRQRRAIDGDEWTVAAPRHPVNQPRDDLLAGARLAVQTDRSVRHRDQLGALDHVTPTWGLSDRGAVNRACRHIHSPASRDSHAMPREEEEQRVVSFP